MSSKAKDAVMALFVPDEFASEDELLPAPPPVDLEVIICPHCGQNNAEVWSTTDAKLATCNDCETEFSPVVIESEAKRSIVQIVERRAAARRRIAQAKDSAYDKTKKEIQRLIST